MNLCCPSPQFQSPLCSKINQAERTSGLILLAWSRLSTYLRPLVPVSLENLLNWHGRTSMGITWQVGHHWLMTFVTPLVSRPCHISCSRHFKEKVHYSAWIMVQLYTMFCPSRVWRYNLELVTQPSNTKSHWLWALLDTLQHFTLNYILL